MTFSIEFLCGHVALVRRHPDGGGFGAPYDWCCTVTADGEIKGVVTMANFGMGHVRALFAFLREHGYGRVYWERRKGARAVTREAPI
jgi:hypothetical protein